MKTQSYPEDVRDLLIHGSPLVFSPQLAAFLGLNEAIVVQQIRYWMGNPKIGVLYEGVKYVRNTLRDWHQENFFFWSFNTVVRTLESLEEKGILKTRSDLNQHGYDRTKWYTIDWEFLQSIYSKWVKASTQNDEKRLPENGTTIPETTQRLPDTTVGQADEISVLQSLTDEEILGRPFPENMRRTEPISIEERKNRIRDALIESNNSAVAEAARAGFDASGYPEDVLPFILEFVKLWNLRPPAGRGNQRKNGHLADWISGARALKEAAGEFGLDALREYHKHWQKEVENNGGVSKIIISRPGSLVNPVRWTASQMRSGNGLAPKKKSVHYSEEHY